jgi:hypothetical protein
MKSLVIDTSEKGVTKFTAYVSPGQRAEAFKLLKIAIPAVELLDQKLKATKIELEREES